MVVVFRVFGAVALIGALGEFVFFVVRMPALWLPDYNERLAERPPRLSKQNMNRGDFMIHFGVWVLRSRIRAAVLCVLTAYWGWRFSVATL